MEGELLQKKRDLAMKILEKMLLGINRKENRIIKLQDEVTHMLAELDKFESTEIEDINLDDPLLSPEKTGSKRSKDYSTFFQNKKS